MVLHGSQCAITDCTTSKHQKDVILSVLAAAVNSLYAHNHQGQLSLPSFTGRLIEYQPVWLGLGAVCSLVSGGR